MSREKSESEIIDTYLQIKLNVANIIKGEIEKLKILKKKKDRSAKNAFIPLD